MRDPAVHFNIVAQLIVLHRGLASAAPEVLLGLRQNTAYGDGLYSFPAGHIEPFEPIEVGLMREMQEELDMPAQHAAAMEHVLTVDHLKDFGRNVPPSQRFRQVAEFFFLLDEANLHGQLLSIKNNEPQKCAHLKFFPIDALPINILPITAHVLQLLAQPQPAKLSQFGWDNPDFAAWRAEMVAPSAPASSSFSLGRK